MKLKWTFDTCHKEALKYDNKTAFRFGSPSAHNAAQTNKWMDQICSHMPKHKDMSGKNNPAFKWTNEELHEIALRHTTKPDFRRLNLTAFNIASRRGILDQICGHMEVNYQYRTDEWVASEAKKFNGRAAFFRGSPKAYEAAKDRKILDKVCSHMKYKSCVSSLEEDLFNIIKNLFPTAKKIRDRKVKIEGKPYIKGFDIDIFIPELNLGIEFDGTYHHSFEYMRASSKKKLWSDDDIRNYHEIKDAWFATKGIQILHIGEDSWFNNKQACVQRCLDFLASGVLSEVA